MFVLALVLLATAGRVAYRSASMLGAAVSSPAGGEGYCCDAFGQGCHMGTSYDCTKFWSTDPATCNQVCNPGSSAMGFAPSSAGGNGSSVGGGGNPSSAASSAHSVSSHGASSHSAVSSSTASDDSSAGAASNSSYGAPACARGTCNAHRGIAGCYVQSPNCPPGQTLQYNTACVQDSCVGSCASCVPSGSNASSKSVSSQKSNVSSATTASNGNNASNGGNGSYGNSGSYGNAASSKASSQASSLAYSSYYSSGMSGSSRSGGSPACVPDLILTCCGAAGDFTFGEPCDSSFMPQYNSCAAAPGSVTRRWQGSMYDYVAGVLNTDYLACTSMTSSHASVTASSSPSSGAASSYGGSASSVAASSDSSAGSAWSASNSSYQSSSQASARSSAKASSSGAFVALRCPAGLSGLADSQICLPVAPSTLTIGQILNSTFFSVDYFTHDSCLSPCKAARGDVACVRKTPVGYVCEKMEWLDCLRIPQALTMPITALSEADPASGKTDCEKVIGILSS